MGCGQVIALESAATNNVGMPSSAAVVNYVVTSLYRSIIRRVQVLSADIRHIHHYTSCSVPRRLKGRMERIGY